MKTCTKCDKTKRLSDFNKQKTTKDGYQYQCRKCSNEAITKYHRTNGHIAMSENKKCSQYLGIIIAERLCKHLFKNVEVMPHGNPGFDFICAKNKKIDVKSACIIISNGKYPHWKFRINGNQIADYFLLIAFDNRDNLKPQHQWLIPSHILNNHKNNAQISTSTINKWSKWKQPIDEAITCCNTIKNSQS